MNKAYVLDACALIAYLSEEDGAVVVQDLLNAAERGECKVFMHAINLLEVYYGVRKEYGEIAASEMLENVKEESITVESGISESMILDAGRLKSQYRISLADSVGLAQAILLSASFVTSDHHELDIVDTVENVGFTWFR